MGSIAARMRNHFDIDFDRLPLETSDLDREALLGLYDQASEIDRTVARRMSITAMIMSALAIAASGASFTKNYLLSYVAMAATLCVILWIAIVIIVIILPVQLRMRRYKDQLIALSRQETAT